MAVYALLGTSRPLSVSTTTTIAILTGAALAPPSHPGGGRGAGRRARRSRCWWAPSCSWPPRCCAWVRREFHLRAGAGRLQGRASALVIVVDQFPKLLGIHFEKGDFLHNLAAIARTPAAHVGADARVARWRMIVIARSALEHSSRARRRRWSRWCWASRPQAPRPGTAGVAVVGCGARPGLPALTLPDFGTWWALWPAAVGIALMSFTEIDRRWPGPSPERRARARSRTGNCSPPAWQLRPARLLRRDARRRRHLADRREPAGRRALAGGRRWSPRGGARHMLLLAPLIGAMPQATLAAVVIVYSVGLIEPRRIPRDPHACAAREFRWALVALAGVVLLGTLQGILVAIVVSLLALAYQVSDPAVYVLAASPAPTCSAPALAEHPEDETYPGLLLVRPEGRIFFANAGRLGQKVDPADRERAAEGGGAAPARRVRPGVHGPEDVDRIREAPARSRRHRVAGRPEPRGAGDGAAVAAGRGARATSACSTTSNRPWLFTSRGTCASSRTRADPGGTG